MPEALPQRLVNMPLAIHCGRGDRPARNGIIDRFGDQYLEPPCIRMWERPNFLQGVRICPFDVGRRRKYSRREMGSKEANDHWSDNDEV